MKALYGAAVALILVSCGIETVSVLPSPNVDYGDQPTAATGYEVMTFKHDADLYDGTDFVGYEVYYRVYAFDSNYTGHGRLQADSTTLNSGPLSTLQTMGYTGLTQSTSNDADSVTSLLQIVGPDDGDEIALDFSEFLSAGNTASTEVQPAVTINGATTVYLYRTSNLTTGEDGLQKFSTLRTDATKRSDTSAVSVSKTYEVEVFLVAYGLTDTIETIRSTPKAWGTIQYIKP